MTALAQRSERTVEERIARLESHVEHIQFDITDLKADVRRLDQKLDGLEQKFDGKFESLKDSVFELRLTMEQGFVRITYWGLGLYVALAGGLLGVMAKGFGWIR
jgi:hypothetical protein